MGRERDGGLCFVRLGFRAQVLAGARDRESLLVEQLLDAQDVFDIPLAIHALSRAAFYRLQLRELRLPEPQDVGWEVAQGGHLADAEIELVGDEDFFRAVLRRVLLPGSHFWMTRQKPCRPPIVTQVQGRGCKNFSSCVRDN
jgi:hypothetical protein